MAGSSRIDANKIARLNREFVLKHYPRAYVSYEYGYGFIIMNEADGADYEWDRILGDFCAEPEHAWNCAAEFMRLEILRKFES